MLRSRLFCAVAAITSSFFSSIPGASAQTAEFRGFWADVFHVGFKSPAECDALIARAVEGRYNAILPEVLAYQDNAVGSHGAYWNSSIVPKSTSVVAGFDPLAYLVQKAHANGIQVHPWLVAFRVSSSWPPAGNAFLAAHPEYLMVPLASMGTVAPVGSAYEFDPGSPDVQEYLISIVRELATNYEIDGIHWDYIRYTQTDAGYPESTSYENSSLARFRRITGYTGTPPATGNTAWNDFRRRSITELIRRTRAELASMTHPRQPLRHSASLITWGGAPSSFSGSSAWGLFQNWEEWMRLGFLDTGIPMTYYDYSVYPTYFTSWVQKEMAWRYQRQMVVGPGIYLNTFADSLTEMQYARSQGADGLCTYSYWATKKSSANDWTWYNYVATNLFTAPAVVPTMPWRDPATATEGTLWGRVLDPATGLPIDDASVQVGSLAAVKTDGNGYYVVTMVPATAAGTAYSVTMTKAGYPTMTHNDVLVVAGDVHRDDFTSFGPPPPTITQQPLSQAVCSGGTATFTVGASGALSYQWQKDGVDLTDGGHYAGIGTATLTITGVDATDAGSFRCVITGEGATSVTSAEAGLALNSAPVITQDPVSQTVDSGATATFTVTATADGTLAYRWQKNGDDLTDGGPYSGTGTATLVISNAATADAAGYRCVVTTDCGAATSAEATLTVNLAPGALSVSPAGGMAASGNVGGPFSPASITYTLTNTGDTAIDWTTAATQSWVTLSKTAGTLVAGGTDTVVVSINTGANSLPAGSYSDTVTFTNMTNGVGNTTRAVSLTFTAIPGAMSVTPTGGLSSSGVRGGPFTPSSITYTVTNTGGQSINWTAAKTTAAWLTLSNTGGTLASGASASVVVSINSNANTLKQGTYMATVTFTNSTNGIGNTTRSVTLQVRRR